MSKYDKLLEYGLLNNTRYDVLAMYKNGMITEELCLKLMETLHDIEISIIHN